MKNDLRFRDLDHSVDATAEQSSAKRLRSTAEDARVMPRLRALAHFVRATAVGRAVSWVASRSAYLLALLPVLTDWLDSGHWPHHPSELVTEIFIGALILVGVWLLYRRSDHFQLMAETDAVTGLWNRRRFRQDLDAAVAAARATARPLALAIVDVDHFKQTNDRYGHHFGDSALRDLGRALQGSIRSETDRCYRLGGDEFAVIFVGANATGAAIALQRGFERTPARIAQGLSCSVGVVEALSDASPYELEHRADALMYAAKRGRTIMAVEAHTALLTLSLRPATTGVE